MGQAPRSGHRWRDPSVAVRIAFLRGVLAIVLAAFLALEGGHPGSALVNFMGVYWLLAGLAALRWGTAAERPRRRLPFIAGAVGIVTGVVVLTMSLTGVPSLTFVLVVLGIAIGLTGVIHVLGGFELADLAARRWRPGVPLGILEIGLGLSLILSAGQIGTWGLRLASVWALLSGVILVSDALRIRRRLLEASGHP